MTEPVWIAEAFKYLGLAECPGEADNPAILKMYAESGHPNTRHDAVPWCAAFVGAVLHRSGLKGTGTLWALDYARWGQRLDSPITGAIATKSRLGGGHVFFVVGYDNRFIWGLGGNQSDSVCVVPFHRDTVHSYCWPAGIDVPADRPIRAPYVDRAKPAPVAALPAVRIVTVKDAQAALNELGAWPRLDVDGIDGPMTRKAVMAWQKGHPLHVTAEIDDATRASLAAALTAKRQA